MSWLKAVENALLDYEEGLGREVNFVSPTWNGVAQFLKNLERQFKVLPAFDADGNSLKAPLWETATSSARGSDVIILRYEGGVEIITDILVSIWREDEGSPSVEITFFPNDVLRSVDLGEKFIAWIEEMQKHLQACGYFCRYENVSWRFGDAAPGTGVFFFVSDIAGPML